MPDINNPTIFDIKYHFAWHTKFKTPILTGSLRERARELLRQDCKVKGISILGGRMGDNYVYMQLSCPAHRSPSEIMRLLKGRSSRLLQEEFPHLKEMNFHGAVWDSGYFCASFGDVKKDIIEKYIGRSPRLPDGFQP